MFESPPDLMAAIVEKAGKYRFEHLEMLAAAFLKKTNLDPEECELVEVMDGTSIRWFFRKKGSV